MRPNEQPPLFPINSWNHHDSIMQNLGRTNNAMEGYHKALQNHFTSHHPPFSKSNFIIFIYFTYL